MAAVRGVLERVRQPEYTGENRCTPCTVVNVVIAALLSAALGAAALPSLGAAGGVAVGAAAFLLSAAAIYLRGYLVPGTPALTERYLPDAVLRRFGKDPTVTGSFAEAELDEPAEGRDDVEPEAVLVEAGALEECAGGEDLCLTDEFRASWYGTIEEIREAGAEKRHLGEALGVDADELSFEDYVGDAFSAWVGERTVGIWESNAALIADVAAARELRDRHDGWAALSVPARGDVVYALRVFLDTCPECGGPVALEQDQVESCCGSHLVAAMSCEGCDSRLFELEV